MSNEKWTVQFRVFRQPAGGKPSYKSYTLEVDPEEYVLDGVERIWAFHDRSLTFRHACHHSACGACGMRVNGVEKLTCITLIKDVTHNGGTITVEPLRNFPIISDLVVDMGQFYRYMEEAGADQVLPVAVQPVDQGIRPQHEHRLPEMERLVDCLECGLCVSACPAAATDPEYRGPAVLAAIQQNVQVGDLSSLHQADSDGGIWRCHSAYECSEVCPSFVEPGWRIMDLRKRVIGHRIKSLFTRKEEVPA